MVIRFGLVHVLAVALPLVGIAASLAWYPGYWEPVGRHQAEPAWALIITSAVLVATLVLTYLTIVRDALSHSFWYRFHFVRSDPTQAGLALILVRLGALAALWGLAVLAVTGRG